MIVFKCKMRLVLDLDERLWPACGSKRLVTIPSKGTGMLIRLLEVDDRRNTHAIGWVVLILIVEHDVAAIARLI
jgi:hypothetical protein